MRSMVVGNLATGATPVAVRQENTSQNVIFTFETGAALTGGATAPARRAVIGFSDGALTNLTTDGTQLTANMVAWAAEGDAALTTAAGQALTPTLLASTAASVCPPSAVAVACWNMNDTGTTMVDAVNPSANNVSGATGSATAKGVSRPGATPTNYLFQGWSNPKTPSGNSINYNPATGVLTPNALLDANYGQVVLEEPDISRTVILVGFRLPGVPGTTSARPRWG